MKMKKNIYPWKVDSILQMLVSILNLNSNYLQEFETSKVQVSWKELSSSCKQPHSQVFDRKNISAEKFFFFGRKIFY
jgi:hypothetical protein